MKTKIKIICIITLIIFSKAFTNDNLHLIATMTGDQTGDLFSVVAGVGDVNGDGFDDVLVGAPGSSYAKLYYGGAPFDTIADLKFANDQKSSKFGCSLDGGGDVNGDGFPDIVIGASHFYESEYRDAGKVYVYLGGTLMDTIPDITMSGTGWHYNFGYSVSFAGDMNNDGYDDIIIGAPFAGYETGGAYIYFGASKMDSIYDVFIEGQEHADMLGCSVDGIGDVNNDGYDEVIIGAPQDLKEESGQAYLFYGGNNIGFSNSIKIKDNSIPDYGSFGRVVSGLGDIDNDGYNDFGIMALDKIFIYLGDVIINTLPDITWIPDRDFGYLNSIGDINKDGFNDIVTVSKHVNIFLGNVTLDTIPDIITSFWATPVSGLGDINGDSYVDIGFGRGGGWDPKGKVYIYSYDMNDNVNTKENLNNIKQYNLNQNYPNPFNTSTTIDFIIDRTEKVHLAVYTHLGHLVETLININMNRGWHSIFWEANELPSGLYLCRLSTETYSDIIKLLLIK